MARIDGNSVEPVGAQMVNSEYEAHHGNPLPLEESNQSGANQAGRLLSLFINQLPI